MDDSNRKFVVVTADVFVHKNEYMEMSKVTEVSESELKSISMLSKYFDNNDLKSFLDNIIKFQIYCLPAIREDIVKIKEIKVLAVIGEIKLV